MEGPHGNWQKVRRYVVPGHPVSRPTRKIFYAGPLTTLSLDKTLKNDRFFYFCGKPGGPRQINRILLLDGKRLGRSSISLPSGEAEWLCPYFDPANRTLRFRKRDGHDSQHVVRLASAVRLSHLAQRKEYQLILRMAQGEGLLDQIPSTSLPQQTFSLLTER